MAVTWGLTHADELKSAEPAETAETEWARKQRVNAAAKDHLDWRCGSQARYTSNSTSLDMPAVCL